MPSVNKSRPDSKISPKELQQLSTSWTLLFCPYPLAQPILVHFEANSSHNCICFDYCEHFGIYILFFKTFLIIETFEYEDRSVR